MLNPLLLPIPLLLRYGLPLWDAWRSFAAVALPVLLWRFGPEAIGWAVMGW